MDNIARGALLIKQLNIQKKAYQQAPMPTYKARIFLLQSLKKSLILHQQKFVNALKLDYGHRAEYDSIIADIIPCITTINYTCKQLKKWMKPERRHAGLMLFPSSVTVHYQPLGVIGIMAPWNFPVVLAINPLITAIAAGNRAMIKLSEFTPHTNKIIKNALERVFAPEQVLLVEGLADVAAKFSTLPFDHLLFTGSTAVAKHVMHAAAKNLTPVTLELGGKSPVIIDKNMPMKTAVARFIFGKCLNAGQICIAPDYVFCPKGKEDQLIAAYQAKFIDMYGNGEPNKDYTQIINSDQQSRLLSWLDDAKTLGATITPANKKEINTHSRHMATQLVTKTTDEMQIMRNEIFGPILPIISYDDLNDVIAYINERAKPLALYIMSFDRVFQDELIHKTHSGGICINDVIMQVVADDAPFGGIGDSGLGQYHGKEGFLTLSKAKTVVKSGKINFGKLIHPPYGGKLQQLFIRLFIH